MRMSRYEPFDPPSGEPTRARRGLLGGLILALLGSGCAKAVVPPSGALTSRTGQAPTGTALSDIPAAPRSTPTSPRPHALVAVTAAGNLESLDPSTGHVVTTLASGAAGDEVSLTPDL